MSKLRHYYALQSSLRHSTRYFGPDLGSSEPERELRPSRHVARLSGHDLSGVHDASHQLITSPSLARPPSLGRLHQADGGGTGRCGQDVARRRQRTVSALWKRHNGLVSGNEGTTGDESYSSRPLTTGPRHLSPRFPATQNYRTFSACAQTQAFGYKSRKSAAKVLHAFEMVHSQQTRPRKH